MRLKLRSDWPPERSRDSGHVFQGPLGGTVKLSACTDAFREAARRAMVRGATLHGLRHTYVSWLLASGVDPVTVASIVGHSSAVVTLNVYGHALVGAQARAVARIDERLAARP